MSEKRPLTLSFPRGESLPVWAFLFAGLMATILGISSVSMISAAYSLATDSFGFLFFVPIFAFLFSYIHARKDIRLSLIAFGGLVLITAGSILANFMMARDAAVSFLSKLANDALTFLPIGGEYTDMPFAMTYFLSLITAIPSFICTWVIIRKRPIIFAILAYLPFIVCTFSLNYRQPTTAPSVAMILAVLMLFIFKNVRKSAQEKTYLDLLKVFIPVLSVLLFLVILNPQSKYRNDELAKKRFESVRTFVENIAERLPWGTGTTREGRKLSAMLGYSGSVRIDEMANNALYMSVEKEDLMKAGNFTNPDWKFMTVTRERDMRYPGNLTGSASYLYLKTASMAWFDGYSWAASAQDLVPADYFTERPITQKEARYTLRIDLDFDAEYAFIPHYVDQYHVDPVDGSDPDPLLSVQETYNINEKALVENKAREYVLAYSNVPVRYTPKWTEAYLDFLYSDCIYVPDESREKILRSNLLPEWYLSLYYGYDQWSTEKTVEAVMSYVRNLKTYDDDTPYPPTDQDFVYWFMHDSKTGFCVHYASTAVVLLRMLDIPARYIKGYLLTGIEDDVPFTVGTADAHAWIEYFHPDYGWIMDDPTPGNQTAASYYNFKAIIQEYGPETTLVTPRPKPTAKPRAELPAGESVQQGAASESEWNEEEEKFSGSRFIGKIFDKVFAATIAVLIVGGVLAVLLFGVRFVFQIFWKKRMKNKDINLSSRAYYRYYTAMAKILKGTSSEGSGDIARKAAFSREGITKEELLDLISKEEKNTDALYKKAGIYRRNLFDLLKIRKNLPLETR